LKKPGRQRASAGSPFDNIHFHMLFLDGVYVATGERLSFRRVPPPSEPALEKLVRGISERVGRTLERQGLVVRDLGAQLSDGGLA
jgi:hypothetical protein